METVKKPENIARKDIVQAYFVIVALLVTLKPNSIEQNFNNTSQDLIKIQAIENSFFYICIFVFIGLTLVYYSIEFTKNFDLSKKISLISDASKFIGITFSVITYYCLCEMAIINYYVAYKNPNLYIFAAIIYCVLILLTIFTRAILDPTYDFNFVVPNIQRLFEKLKHGLSEILFFISAMFILGLIVIGTFLRIYMM